MSTVAGFQPMPDLTPEQYAALRADIETHGIRVPITRDQHGRVIDGHNRLSIGTELGVVVPETRIHVADDDEAHDAALTLNCARRHLTGEQKRALIGAELVRRWGDSDRAISRRVGCSPSTVGTVRAERVADAERRTVAIRDAMDTIAGTTWGAATDLLLSGADLSELLDRARAGQAAARVGVDFGNPASIVSHYVLNVLTNGLADLSDALGPDWSGRPLTVPAADLAAMVDGLFDSLGLSNLDSRLAVS